MIKKLKIFLIYQIKEIKEGNISKFLNKLFKLVLLLRYFPGIFLALIFLPLIYISRPFICIRFCKIQSDRIGYLATSLRIYNCYKDYYSKTNNIIYLDIFCTNGFICNKFLFAKLKKNFFFISRFVLVPHIILNNIITLFFPKLNEHCNVPIVTNDHLGLLNEAKPLIHFSNNEHKIGEIFLKKLGIKEYDKFVCLHVRDNAYLKKIYPKGNWSHHNFRDADIDTYIDAVKEIIRRGYFVIIMGVYSNKKISMKHPKLVDYANSSLRSDFLDVYLSYKCSLLISGGCSGFIGLPMHFFNKPHLLTNYAPITDVVIGCAYSKNFIVLGKKIENKNGKILSLSESIKILGTDGFVTEDYDSREIKLIDNSSEELLDATAEMLDKLELYQTMNKTDINLQKKFWKLYMANNKIFDKYNFQNNSFNVTYSKSFLEKNQIWLK